MRRPLPRRTPRGLPLRAVAPNAVTALALCFGLTGIRYAISAEWETAVTMIMIAGVLDGLDGTVARMVRGESRFGAELDSLSDAISFGVSPAIILYLWTLRGIPRVGWIVALVFAVFCALRLARFNANIDVTEQPHKSAGFLTGIPAPAGAGLAMLPLYLSFWNDQPLLRSPWLVMPWVALIATLMVSSIATYSWGSLKLRNNIRFEAIVVVVILGAALISAPWHTLSAICLAYLATMPFSVSAYRRVRRLRGALAVEPQLPLQAPDERGSETGAR
ncbi:MAG: phosphatidylcholine/phosphatidylserine synthase [Pseudomonadota bacterium]